MTPEDINIEIQTYLETLIVTSDFSTVTEHTYEGIPNSTEPDPQEDTWVLFSIRLIDTEVVEKGGTEALGIRNGNLHINVFTPKNGGTNAGANLAGKFELDLRRRTLTNIVFSEPNTVFPKSQDWFNHHTVIPFWTTIGE